MDTRAVHEIRRSLGPIPAFDASYICRVLCAALLSNQCPVTLDEFKHALLHTDLQEFVDSVVLSGVAQQFGHDHVQYVALRVAERYGVPADVIDVRVVGSAKLGFGLMEKKTQAGDVLPRFRPFRPDSDIDLAVVSASLFELLWDELSAHAIRSPRMPWDSGKLGDYMVLGWLRPDFFPRNARLRRCDDWWDLFRAISSDARLGRRAVRGALYYSVDHLRRYQLRGLSDCRDFLEAQI